NKGWEIFDTYIDDGFSAETIEERPDFSRLLEGADGRKFNILLVIDEDRICRSRSDLTGAIIYDTFRDNGIRIATPAGTFIDLCNEDQDLYAGMKQVFAKYEKRKILARMRRGRIEKWRQGKLAL